LKGLKLKSVGLGLENVPLHFGWDPVEWNLKLSEKPVDLGVNLNEVVEICDEIKEKEAKVFGPQIEIDLGKEFDLGKPPVEAAGEAPAMVEIGDERSVEEKFDEEMGTGDSPIHRVKAGDSLFEDYPGDDFEKVGEINLEETPQTPFELVLSVPSEETPSGAEPRRKRIKT